MQAIFDVVEEYSRGSEHPDLRAYRRDLEGTNPVHATPFDRLRWVRNLEFFCRVGRFYNGRILEVGCGFGWDAVAISLIGNNSVVACDVLPSMIQGVVECLDSMRQKGKDLHVEPLVADICKNTLPSESFDGIFSSEAIEHVHSLEAMFDECYRLLKPGKRLIVVNDSNRLNTAFRESTFKMWVERDTSWEHAEWLKREIRPVEHKDARPYAAMREDFIKRAAHDLDQSAVDKLKAATAGMIGPDIQKATLAYKATGALPTPPQFSWCRNPETGEYAERLLDPFELKDMLNKAGFRTKLGHAFVKFPQSLLNVVQLRPLSVKLFEMRPLFILCAEKASA
jgi:SAM-dependent methyltransferase